MLNCTQLSFIQLGGGIAAGVHAKQNEILGLPKLPISMTISLAV